MSSPDLFYSAHVIESIDRMIPNFRKQGFLRDAETLPVWADMIRRSVKYALPDRGAFISMS